MVAQSKKEKDITDNQTWNVFCNSDIKYTYL